MAVIEVNSDAEAEVMELRRRRVVFIEKCEEDSCCCHGCCNFRCWAIFLLICKIIGNVAMIVFGSWAINGWKVGQGFGIVILLTSIISLIIHIVALYGVVHGYTNYIFLGYIFELLKLCFDVLYGVILGIMVSAEYFGTALGWVIGDAFVAWVLWRVYNTARSIDNQERL
eukprot:305810_1